MGNTKVDSTTTDLNGNYSLTLDTGSYTFRIFFGTTIDTSVNVVFGTNIFNLNSSLLGLALSAIGGTLHSGTANSAAIVSGAKVVLQHRNSTTNGNNTWVNWDSVTSDVNGIFAFVRLIAAPSPASATNGSYRVLVTANGYRNYPYLASETAADVYQVAFGATLIVTPNIALIVCPTTGTIPPGCPTITSILSDSPNKIQNMRFSLLGDNLVLNLPSSSIIRTLEIFDLKGVRQRNIQIPAGESRVTLPASFAPEKGFLYGLK